MQAMQMSRSSTKKRDAETAFSISANGRGGSQESNWEQEIDGTQESGSQAAVQNQQLLVDNLLKSTRLTTKKLVNGLLDETQKIFSGVEKKVETFQSTYVTESEERIKFITNLVELRRASLEDPVELPLQNLQLLVAKLDGVDLASKSSRDADFEQHLMRRLQHKEQISHTGAQVAQEHMKSSMQNDQLHNHAKAFARAHRDFFKAIQSAQTLL